MGHHSEQRDRNYRAKITNTFRRAFEALEYSRELRARADGVGRAGISSDDPDAVVKLHQQIEDAQRQRDNMKAANRALRMKDQVAGDIRLLELGYSEDRIRNLKTPDEFGATGFPRWRITNLSANIRRLKQRVARLEKQAADDTTTETIGDVKIIDNVEENRVQLEFPGETLGGNPQPVEVERVPVGALGRGVAATPGKPRPSRRPHGRPPRHEDPARRRGPLRPGITERGAVAPLSERIRTDATCETAERQHRHPCSGPLPAPVQNQGHEGVNGFQAGLLRMRPGNQTLAPVLYAHPRRARMHPVQREGRPQGRPQREKENWCRRGLISMWQGESSRLGRQWAGASCPSVELCPRERSLLSRKEHSAFCRSGSSCHYSSHLASTAISLQSQIQPLPLRRLRYAGWIAGPRREFTKNLV